MKLTETKIINANLYKLTYSEEGVPLYQLYIIKKEANDFSFLLKDLENRKEFDSERSYMDEANCEAAGLNLMWEMH